MGRRGKRRRLLNSVILVIVAVITVVAGVESYYFERPKVPGESIGSIPDGSLSDLVWRGGHLYFLWESPEYGSAPELWRIRPGGAAEAVRLAGSSCGLDYSDALAGWPDGGLVLVRECGADSTEIMEVHPESGDMKRIAMVFEYRSPVISSVIRVGGAVFVSPDSALCGGIARVDGSAFTPVPLLKIGTESLDLGRTFEERGDCTGPPAGFVTPMGKGVAFLASMDSVGVPVNRRHGAKWSVYLTGADWASGKRLADGFESPKQMAAFNDCGLLVAAKRNGSSGVWFVGRDGHVGQILEGDVSDFAVQSDGKAIAVMGPDSDPNSVHLIPQPFKGKSACR